ncbi:MAG TPA: hypothetical protein PLK35_00835 [Candidatus Moranbacteria bacterium]|nr:hypothetical protein [Candidatus Moranbacteria bacterium]
MGKQEKRGKRKKKKEEKTLCQVFLCKKNLVRDIVIVLVTIAFSALLIINHRYLAYKKSLEQMRPEKAQEIVEEVEENEAESPLLETNNWLIYQSQWYGFEIKYPPHWEKPALKGATRGANWEYRFLFRKKDIEEGDKYAGFDVVVYNIQKVKELFNTDEFPKIKDEELKNQGVCQEITGHIAENQDYPAEQIYIGPNDDCFSQAFFYTLTRDQYIYNIVPILVENSEETDQLKEEKEIIKNFPEFISSVSTTNLIDIKRPKPAPAKPKINAPKPASYKKVNGQRVCAKKNDKPGKSKQNKKKHMDRECCLDPDEIPNPWCTYNSKRYQKYLE